MTEIVLMQTPDTNRFFGEDWARAAAGDELGLLAAAPHLVVFPPTGLTGQHDAEFTGGVLAGMVRVDPVNEDIRREVGPAGLDRGKWKRGKDEHRRERRELLHGSFLCAGSIDETRGRSSRQPQSGKM